MVRIPETLKVCNIFRLEIIKKRYNTNCAITELNTDVLMCSAVKWMGWVDPCAGTMGWVGSGV